MYYQKIIKIEKFLLVIFEKHCPALAGHGYNTCTLFIIRKQQSGLNHHKVV